MVKGLQVLISEFAAKAGISVDTVRYYVRRGLLAPETTRKGGSNPYQIFTMAHVEAARQIRMAQSLGFSLREISALADSYRAGALTPDRGAAVLKAQLADLQDRASQLARMIAYMRAKIAWLEGGSTGPEPRFAEFTSA